MRFFGISQARDVKSSRKYRRIVRRYPELAELDPGDAVSVHKRAEERTITNWRSWLMCFAGGAAGTVGLILVDNIPTPWWLSINERISEFGGPAVAHRVVFWAVALGMLASASFVMVWYCQKLERTTVQHELAKLRRLESRDAPDQ